jgi:hypothetical protein
MYAIVVRPLFNRLRLGRAKAKFGEPSLSVPPISVLDTGLAYTLSAQPLCWYPRNGMGCGPGWGSYRCAKGTVLGPKDI